MAYRKLKLAGAAFAMISSIVVIFSHAFEGNLKSPYAVQCESVLELQEFPIRKTTKNPTCLDIATRICAIGHIVKENDIQSIHDIEKIVASQILQDVPEECISVLSSTFPKSALTKQDGSTVFYLENSVESWFYLGFDFSFTISADGRVDKVYAITR